MTLFSPAVIARLLHGGTPQVAERGRPRDVQDAVQAGQITGTMLNDDLAVGLALVVPTDEGAFKRAATLFQLSGAAAGETESLG